MKSALYARESSDDTNKAPPITGQIEAYEEWISTEGHQDTHRFIDNGFSGGDWRRPDWNRCVREAKRHSFQILWVWDQDRLARDTEQFLYFYRMMKKGPVRIWSHTDGGFIDMETLGGRVKHTSLAHAAEIFRLNTSEKVKKTYERKKRQADKKGVKLVWGRPSKELDIEKVIEFRKSGLGYRAIAKKLGDDVSYQKVRRVLQNRAIM